MLPGEQAPGEPILATQHSMQGAQAFAKFFVQTVDWGYATRSSAYMDHFYETSCVYCMATAQELHQDAAKNEYQVGGRYADYRVAGPQPTSTGYSVAVTVTIGASKLYDASGTVVRSVAAQTGITWTPSLVWLSTGWIVSDANLAL